LPEIYIGTSGWYYPWNEEGTLDWYLKHSGLNAVELNASFYRFPFKNQVISWSRKGSKIRWAVKVNQSITHFRRLNERALEIWWKFYDLFKPLDRYVDFYLFQLPPNYTCKESSLERISWFYRETGLNERFAIEFRHHSCFNDKVVEWGRREGLTIVSVDAPISVWIVTSNDIVYLRMHGRDTWYMYEYSLEELREDAYKIKDLDPEKIYVFFNNDFWMLINALQFKEIIEEIYG